MFSFRFQAGFSHGKIRHPYCFLFSFIYQFYFLCARLNWHLLPVFRVQSSYRIVSYHVLTLLFVTNEYLDKKSLKSVYMLYRSITLDMSLLLYAESLENVTIKFLWMLLMRSVITGTHRTERRMVPLYWQMRKLRFWMVRRVKVHRGLKTLLTLTTRERQHLDNVSRRCSAVCGQCTACHCSKLISLSSSAICCCSLVPCYRSKLILYVVL